MTCSSCSNPAEVRCSKHGINICGSISCIRLHRGGDCEFMDPRKFEFMDWVVAIGSALVVATGIAIVWAHS